MATAVVLANVKFSPNVGDGLLAECMERSLREFDKSLAIYSLDLAGREILNPSRAMARRYLIPILQRLPKSVRAAITKAALDSKFRSVLRDHYLKKLRHADVVVVGGGNLFADHDLNFPIKLANLIELMRLRGIPWIVYGCGVSSSWSAHGRSLICTSLSSYPPAAVYVRDIHSQENWSKLFASSSGLEAEVVFDPGLLASVTISSKCFERKESNERSFAKSIAVGVMSSDAIKYHTGQGPTTSQLRRWYISFVNKLIENGHSVCIFTNGSPEDVSFARKLLGDLSASSKKVEFNAIESFQDLCDLVVGSKAVVAFRMHAIIAAYSFGRPYLALKWDRKLDDVLLTLGDSTAPLDVLKFDAEFSALRLEASIFNKCALELDSERMLKDATSQIQRLAIELKRIGRKSV